MVGSVEEPGERRRESGSHHHEKVVLRQRKQKSRHGKDRKLGQ